MRRSQNIFAKLITGTIIAAGAAILAFKMMDSDEETKKKIKSGLKNVEIKGNEIMDQIKDKGQDRLDDLIKRISKEFDSLRKKIEKSDDGKKFEKTVKKIAEGLKEVQENSRPEVEALAKKLSSEIERLAAEFRELEDQE